MRGDRFARKAEKVRKRVFEGRERSRERERERESQSLTSDFSWLNSPEIQTLFREGSDRFGPKWIERGVRRSGEKRREIMKG